MCTFVTQELVVTGKPCKSFCRNEFRYRVKSQIFGGYLQLNEVYSFECTLICPRCRPRTYVFYCVE